MYILSGIQRDAFGADDEFTEYWNNAIDIEALFSTILSSVTVADSGTWTMDDNVVLEDVLCARGNPKNPKLLSELIFVQNMGLKSGF